MHRQQAHTSIERNGRKRERAKTFFFEFFCSKVQTKYKKHRSQMKTPKKKKTNIPSTVKIGACASKSMKTIEKFPQFRFLLEIQFVCKHAI